MMRQLEGVEVEGATATRTPGVYKPLERCGEHPGVGIAGQQA